MPEPRSPRSRRSTDLPVGPIPSSEQKSDRAPEGTDGDVDRGAGAGRQEGVESVPREGEVGEAGGRSPSNMSSGEQKGAPRGERDDASDQKAWRPMHEGAPSEASQPVDERQQIREKLHHGKS